MSDKRDAVSVARRRQLAKRGEMACPRTLDYPLDTKARTKNAMARYRQPQTKKCKGGMKRICKAYRRHKLTHTEAFKKHCG